MPNKIWTMNCLIAGAELARLLKNKEETRAREYLRSLSSELDQTDVKYVVTRIYDVIAKEG